MRRASYREGVAWIALNDNAGEIDSAENIAAYMTTTLLADMFDTDTARVARDVVSYRKRERVGPWAQS